MVKYKRLYEKSAVRPAVDCNDQEHLDAILSVSSLRDDLRYWQKKSDDCLKDIDRLRSDNSCLMSEAVATKRDLESKDDLLDKLRRDLNNEKQETEHYYH